MDDSLKSPRPRVSASPRPRVSPSVLLLLGLFLAVSAWRQDVSAFGYFHDDTLYFSSAQALASGKGYIMPSVPGTPFQTKYPALYPWLLAGVWKLNPQFPDNISLSLWLTALAGCFLVAGWVALLKSLGAGSLEALVVAGISAFHPFTLSLTGAILSDVPFMAFAVWAAVLAHRGGRRDWWAAAACSGLAVLTRSIGVAVIAGIAAAALYRKAYRRGFLFLALGAPFLAASLVWARGKQLAIDGLPGYRQTMLFYTSYWEFWKLSVPDLSALGAVAVANFLEILKAPAMLGSPLPAFTDNVYLQGAVIYILSLGVLFGVGRLGRQTGWPPVYFVFFFYAAVVLLWNYPLANRFLVLFLPLFLLGAVREGGRLARAVRRAFRSPASWSKRLGTAALAGAVSMALLGASYSYLWGLRAQVALSAADRQALAPEKLEAYEWIRARTSPADRFISYEDAALFLYAGRQSLRPLAFSSEAQYRNQAAVVQQDLEKLTDVARQIRARYWVSSPDDYQLEEGAPAIQERTQLLLRHFPVAFQSSRGNVRVYEVSAY